MEIADSPALGMLVSQIARDFENSLHHKVREKGYDLSWIGISLLLQTSRANGITPENFSQLTGLPQIFVAHEMNVLSSQDFLIKDRRSKIGMVYTGRCARELLVEIHKESENLYSMMEREMNTSERASLRRLLEEMRFSFSDHTGRNSLRKLN